MIQYLKKVKNNPRLYIQEVKIIVPAVMLIMNGLIMFKNLIQNGILKTVWQKNYEKEQEKNHHIKQFISIILLLLMIISAIKLYQPKYLTISYVILFVFAFMCLWQSVFGLLVLLKKTRKSLTNQYEAVDAKNFSYYFNGLRIIVPIIFLIANGLIILGQFFYNIKQQSFNYALNQLLQGNKKVSLVMLIFFLLIAIYYCLYNKDKIFKNSYEFSGLYISALVLMIFIGLFGLWIKLDQLINLCVYYTNKNNLNQNSEDNINYQDLEKLINPSYLLMNPLTI